MGVNKPSGFTLIELVIGIVVFSIALVLFTSLVVPQAIRSVDPIFQVRASELGKSLINEIASKSFDEASDRTGGLVLCSASVAPICTASGSLGAEEGLRQNFDDVDDYHNLNESGASIENSLGGTSGLYTGFNVQVTVVYDASMDGITDTSIGNTKLITVTVSTPNDEDIIFSTFRSNY